MRKGLLQTETELASETFGGVEYFACWRTIYLEGGGHSDCIMLYRKGEDGQRHYLVGVGNAERETAPVREDSTVACLSALAEILAGSIRIKMLSDEADD